MNQLDEFLQVRDTYVRYVDDIHVFCDSEIEARDRLYAIAEYLDSTQKLQLNAKKTEILSSKEFIDRYVGGVSASPISDAEEQMVTVLEEKNVGPYENLTWNSLNSDERRAFEAESLEEIFEPRLNAASIQWKRIRWLCRRIGQVGSPYALEYFPGRLTEFEPAIGDVARAIFRGAQSYQGGIGEVGEIILDYLGSEDRTVSEYVEICLLSVFWREAEFNNFSRLSEYFDGSSSQFVRRAIILAGHAQNQTGWIRGFRNQFSSLNRWQRAAVIFAMERLPEDERRHFLRKKRGRTELENRVIQNVL